MITIGRPKRRSVSPEGAGAASMTGAPRPSSSGVRSGGRFRCRRRSVATAWAAGLRFLQSLNWVPAPLRNMVVPTRSLDDRLSVGGKGGNRPRALWGCADMPLDLGPQASLSRPSGWNAYPSNRGTSVWPWHHAAARDFGDKGGPSCDKLWHRGADANPGESGRFPKSPCLHRFGLGTQPHRRPKPPRWLPTFDVSRPPGGHRALPSRALVTELAIISTVPAAGRTDDDPRHASREAAADASPIPWLRAAIRREATAGCRSVPAMSDCVRVTICRWSPRRTAAALTASAPSSNAGPFLGNHFAVRRQAAGDRHCRSSNSAIATCARPVSLMLVAVEQHPSMLLISTSAIDRADSMRGSRERLVAGARPQRDSRARDTRAHTSRRLTAAMRQPSRSSPGR